jgi:hypothetical protein
MEYWAAEDGRFRRRKKPSRKLRKSNHGSPECTAALEQKMDSPAEASVPCIRRATGRAGEFCGRYQQAGDADRDACFAV